MANTKTKTIRKRYNGIIHTEQTEHNTTQNSTPCTKSTDSTKHKVKALMEKELNTKIIFIIHKNKTKHSKTE